MYSQNDEERVILEYAEQIEPKRFLDIGAYDGIAFSNTYALYQKGWSGVYVEADLACFELLKKNLGGSPRTTLVNKCVDCITGRSPFYSSKSMVSTLSERHRDHWSKCSTHYDKIILDTIDVSGLLSLVPGPYGFITIDVEGIDYVVLEQFDLKALEVKLLCVECNYQEERPAYRKLMNEKGFKVIHETDENLIGVYEA